MIVLGLLLILAAGGAALFAVMAPSAAAQTIELSALGLKVSASPLAMFVAGAVSVVLLGLGFALISRGARRTASSRKELRDLRKAQAATDAPAPAQAGQHSTRRDRSSAGTSTDTGRTNGAGTDSGKGTGDKDSGTSTAADDTRASTGTGTSTSPAAERDTSG
jgi:hypothetical protein